MQKELCDMGLLKKEKPSRIMEENERGRFCVSMKFWTEFKKKHPAAAQLILFFLVSNGVTVLQMILMPLIK